MSVDVPRFIVGGAVTAIGIVTGQGWLASIGLSVAASAITVSLAARDATFKANTVSPQNPIHVVYGERLVGGPVADYRVHTGNRRWLFIVVCVSHGSGSGEGIEGIREIFMDGHLAVRADSPDLGSNGFLVVDNTGVEGFYASVLDYGKYLGSVDQGVPLHLNHMFPDHWPTSSRGRGIAHIVVAVKNEPDVFSGVPIVTAIVRGVHVYDPRTGTWDWSNNPALCIRDYLVNAVYGRGVPLSEIDEDSFILAADHCDELLPTPVEDPEDPEAFILEPRYACNGVVDTGRPVSENLRNLESSCNGQVIYQAGKWRLVIRSQQEPSGYRLDESMMVGDLSWKLPGLRGDGANSVLVNFVDPDNEWQVESLQWPRPGAANPYLIEDNGFEAPISMDLPFTISPYAALRIARTRLLELREGDRIAFPCRPDAMALAIGDIVTVPHGLFSDLEQVDAWIVGMGLAQSGLVELGLMRYNPEAYEEPDLAEIALPPSDPAPVEEHDVIEGLSLGAVLECVGDHVAATVVVSWENPPDADSSLSQAASLGHAATRVRWREVTEEGNPGAWQQLPDVVAPDNTATIHIPHVRIEEPAPHVVVGGSPATPAPPAPEPTPEEQASAGQGEPSGMTAIAIANFANYPTDGDGSSTSRPWNDVLGQWSASFVGSNNRRITDSTFPGTGDKVVEFRFPAGQSWLFGAAPGRFDGWSTLSTPRPTFRRLYYRWWMRFMPGPDGLYEARGGVNKTVWAGVGAPSPTNTLIFDCHAHESTVSSEKQNQVRKVKDLQPRLAMQNHIGGSRWGNSRAVKVGPWQLHEIYLETNDVGVANGIVRWTIDGRLIVSASNVVYRTPGFTHHFGHHQFNPTFGGAACSSCVKSRHDFLRVGGWYISGGN